MKLLLLGLLIATPALASDLFSLKPTVLQPEDGPDFVPAARIASSYKAEREFGRPDRFLSFSYALESTVSTEPKANDEKTELDVRGGISWDLDAVPVAPAFPGRGQASGQPTPLPVSSGFRWGSLDAQLAVAFEGDEPMANKSWTYGGRLNYTPSLADLTTQWWVPFIWVDYRRVSEVSTELTAKYGSPAQDYWRFGSAVYWQVPLSSVFGEDTFWRTVKFVPGFQYYRSTDRQFAPGDLNDAFYYSGALDYTVPTTLGWSKQVAAIRLQVASGRIPPGLENRTTVSLAVTLHWDKLIK